MNRVSNSYKIGQKGMIFLGDLMYLGLVFMQNFCKRVCILEIYILIEILPSFVIFYRLWFIKDPINCTCLGVKLLHDYLFRVEKGKKILV